MEKNGQKNCLGGLARYSVHLAASTVPFWNVAKWPKMGQMGYFHSHMDA